MILPSVNRVNGLKKEPLLLIVESTSSQVDNFVCTSYMIALLFINIRQTTRNNIVLFTSLCWPVDSFIRYLDYSISLSFYIFIILYLYHSISLSFYNFIILYLFWPDKTKKSGRRLVGDVEFAEARKRAAWITPVPGGMSSILMFLCSYVFYSYFSILMSFCYSVLLFCRHIPWLWWDTIMILYHIFICRVFWILPPNLVPVFG